VGRHRCSLPIGPQRRIRVARLSPRRGPGPAHRSGPGQGGPPARPRESSARLRRGRLKVYHGANRWNVLRFTESWKARASPSARPMRVARWNPASAFPSGRGHHLTRRSSRRTDGRQRSDGEAPRSSATGEGRPDVDRRPRRRRRHRPPRPTCGPPRRLLVLLPQQQVDALSDHAANHSGAHLELLRRFEGPNTRASWRQKFWTRTTHRDTLRNPAPPNPVPGWDPKR
jgi:hypothetical protein